MRFKAKSTLSVFLSVCLLLSSFGSMLAVTLAEQVSYYTYTQDFENYKQTADGGIGWFRTQAYTMVDKTTNTSALTYSGNKAFERQAKSDNHPLIRIIDDSSKTLTVGKNYRAYVYTTAAAGSKTTFWMGGNTASVVDGSRSKTEEKWVHKAYNPAVPSTEKDYSRGLIYNVGTAGDFNILAGTFTAEKENLYFYNSNTTASYTDDFVISEIIPGEKIQATLGADSTGMGTVKVENAIAEFNTATETKNYITAGVQYAVGETAVYTATAAEGYIFDCWKDANGNPVSNSATYEVALDSTLSKATVLTAHFKEKTTDFYTYTQDFENYPTTSGWVRAAKGSNVLNVKSKTTDSALVYEGDKALYREEVSDAHARANIITDANKTLTANKVYRVTFQMNMNGGTLKTWEFSFRSNTTDEWKITTNPTVLTSPVLPANKATARPIAISEVDSNGYQTFASTITATTKYLHFHTPDTASKAYFDNFVISEVIPSGMITASVADTSSGMGTVKVENSVAEFNTATNDKNYITAGAQYALGETAVYTATAGEGYRFVAWKDAEGNTVSTDATYNLVLSDLANIKTDLYAHFEAAPFDADTETEDISKWFLAHKQELVGEEKKITTGQKNLPGYGTEEVPAEKINCFSKLPEDAAMPWLTVDEEVVKSGNYSLEVRANPGYLYTIFDNLEKDTDYRVSFWYNSPVVYKDRGSMINFAGIYDPNLETATLGDKTDGYLNLIAYNHAYTTKDGIYSKRRVNTFRTTDNITPEGTTPVAANAWNYMELTFNSANYSELALVICTAVGQTPYTVYIDDVKFEKGGATIKAPVVTDIKEPQDQVSIDFDNRGGDATFQQTDRFEVITDKAFDETQSKMLHIKQGEYTTTTVLNSTNTTNGIDKYFSIPVKPDHQYEITLRAKVGSGLVSDWLSFIAKHGTNSTTIATPMRIEAKDVWRDYRAVVIMGDDEDVLSFTLNGGKKTPEIWIDDIVITDMGVPTMFEGHNGPTDEFVVNFDDFYVPVDYQERMGVLLAPERDGKQTNALHMYEDVYTNSTTFSLSKAARYTDPIFTIPVKPNTLYEYSFWVYLEEGQSKVPYWSFYVNYGGDEAYVTPEGPDISKRGTMLVYRVGGFATTGQWVKQSVEFITGPEQYYISTAFDAGNTVKACWLDDITLKEIKPGVIDEISLTYCEDMYNLFTEENVKSVSQGKTQSIKLNLQPNTTYSFGITATGNAESSSRVFLSNDGTTPLNKSDVNSPDGIVKADGTVDKRYGYRLATDSSGVLYLVIENNDGSLKLSDPDFFVPASLSCKIPMGYEENPNIPLKQPESIEVVWAKDTLQSTTDVEESEDEEYDDFEDSEEYDDYEDFDDSDEFDDYEDLEETDTQESPDDSDETEESEEKDSSIVIKFILPAILLVIIIAVAVFLILKFKKGGKHNEK